MLSRPQFTEEKVEDLRLGRDGPKVSPRMTTKRTLGCPLRSWEPLGIFLGPDEPKEVTARRQNPSLFKLRAPLQPIERNPESLKDSGLHGVGWGVLSLNISNGGTLEIQNLGYSRGTWDPKRESDWL